jgi:hypothetical protein
LSRIRFSTDYELVAEIGAEILVMALLLCGMSYLSHCRACHQPPLGSRLIGSKPDIYIPLQAQSLPSQPIDVSVSDAPSGLFSRRRRQHRASSLAQLETEITDTYQHVVNFFKWKDNPLNTVLAIGAVEREGDRIMKTPVDGERIQKFTSDISPMGDIPRMEWNRAKFTTA